MEPKASPADRRLSVRSILEDARIKQSAPKKTSVFRGDIYSNSGLLISGDEENENDNDLEDDGFECPCCRRR
jgi:hypothetical protein